MKNPEPRIIVQAALTPAERRDAACAQETDPFMVKLISDLFFPVVGAPATQAKAICSGCDVRMRCLEVALTNKEQVGVFGGMSPVERRDLLRERKKEQAA